MPLMYFNGRRHNSKRTSQNLDFGGSRAKRQQVERRDGMLATSV